VIKAVFSASLLQSSVSHDPSEISHYYENSTLITGINYILQLFKIQTPTVCTPENVTCMLYYVIIIVIYFDKKIIIIIICKPLLTSLCNIIALAPSMSHMFFKMTGPSPLTYSPKPVWTSMNQLESNLKLVI